MKKLIIAVIIPSVFGISLISPAQASTSSCKLTQAIEEGPYYLSSTPTRSDVTDGQPGKSITIKFKIVDSECKPVKGARVDIWYANAQGAYSGVSNKGDDLGAGVNSGKFLRGTQLADKNGMVTFKGIYPGWYPTRTIHIHEKIWIKNKEVLTTQTYFTDAQNAAMMSQPPYNARGKQKVTNVYDMLLSRGNIDLKQSLMKFDGSVASATIVVKK